jgi:hypothetical protein
MHLNKQIEVFTTSTSANITLNVNLALHRLPLPIFKHNLGLTKDERKSGFIIKPQDALLHKLLHSNSRV